MRELFHHIGARMAGGGHPTSTNCRIGHRYILDWAHQIEQFTLWSVSRICIRGVYLSVPEATRVVQLLAAHREGGWGRDALRDGFHEPTGSHSTLTHRPRGRTYVLKGLTGWDKDVGPVILNGWEADTLIVELGRYLRAVSGQDA